MARGTRPPCPLPERLFVWSVLAFLAVAVVLLLADPDTWQASTAQVTSGRAGSRP
jgi:hypothetical protein